MKRFLHAIYCDDIREEKTNKLTLVGVYSADLYVAEFPTVIPKLGILVTVATPNQEPFQHLELKVKQDDEVIIQISTSQQDLQRALAADRDAKRFAASEIDSDSDSNRLTSVRTVLFLSPFVVIKPCILRVIVTTESGDLRCPALKIGLNPAEPTKESGSGEAVASDESVKESSH